MVNAPDIAFSTVEERREYIRKRYPCIADCDMCGLCKVFHGHEFQENVNLWMSQQIIRDRERIKEEKTCCKKEGCDCRE